MKKILLLLIVFIMSFSLQADHSSSMYTDSGSSTNNTYSSTCWIAPSVPVLTYPLNNTYAGTNSAWNLNPYMDWEPSTSTCLLPHTITYQYESYRDSGLTDLAYRSVWLTNSMIPAPGTPQGSYYWRVRAQDSFGNISDFSAPWLLIVDRTNPPKPTNLHWDNPSVACGGSTNSYTITADWDNVIDPTPGLIDRYEYNITYPKLGGSTGNWTTYVTNSQYSGVFNQDEGIHTYRVRAHDKAGNISEWSDNCTITYDKTAPVISDISHLIATPEETNDLTVTITWDTNEPSTSNYRYRTSSTSWTDVTDDPTADNTSHSRSFTVSDLETYYYEVISTDAAGNTTTSNSGNSFDTGDFDIVADIVPSTDIVINEFLPNPTGDDFAPYPGGEWVEIYNRGSADVDLTGWSISAYNTPTYRLYLNANPADPSRNTYSSDNNNDLIISPGEFMVVYRNGDSTFYLKNNASDRIRLFNQLNQRVDRYIYTASEVLENKSIARFPDGSDTWFDPIPTPLGNNILENTPALSMKFNSDKTEVEFIVLNINEFNKIDYQLTYDSDTGVQGVIGSQDLLNINTFEKNQIKLATCSSGGACTYHTNVSNVKLTVILTKPSGDLTELQSSL